MTDNKLTDEQIMRAFEICHKIDKGKRCKDCPLYNGVDFCQRLNNEQIFGVYTRQKAEIERLKAEADCAEGYAEALVEQAKSELRKELAERLKKKKQLALIANYYVYVVTVEDIDNLLKEMEGE